MGEIPAQPGFRSNQADRSGKDGGRQVIRGISPWAGKAHISCLAFDDWWNFVRGMHRLSCIALRQPDLRLSGSDAVQLGRESVRPGRGRSQDQVSRPRSVWLLSSPTLDCGSTCMAHPSVIISGKTKASREIGLRRCVLRNKLTTRCWFTAKTALTSWVVPSYGKPLSMSTFGLFFSSHWGYYVMPNQTDKLGSESPSGSHLTDSWAQQQE